MNIDDFLREGHDGFHYEPETGRLFKIEEIPVMRLDPDGKVRSKRKYFNGVQRVCTHIIYFMMNGKWPDNLVDHKDNDPWNNRWENLRDATYEQNAHNRQPQGHFGPIGLGTNVTMAPSGRYRVRVKSIHIGTFDTVEEANACAKETRQTLYGEFDYHSNRLDEAQ